MKCINDWLQDNMNCPICKIEININNEFIDLLNLNVENETDSDNNNNNTNSNEVENEIE